MASQLPPPVICRAGCAQECITPPVGASLAGYFHDRVSERVRDDLHVKALVLEYEGTRLALVALDLVCVTDSIASAAKAFIEQEADIPPSHVLICATHTHTGPEIRDGSIVPVMAEWRDTLPRRIADAVVAAANSMFDATVRPGRTTIEGYTWNRLFRLSDGMEVFGKGGRDEEIIGVAGPIDPELVTLGIADTDGRLRALVVNHALHPDVIGGGSATFISADWPGEIGRNIAAVYGDDVVTLFLQGTAGDINHRPHDPTNLPTGGEDKAVQIGRAMAGAAMVATERAEPLTELKLDASLEVIQVPYYTRDDKLWAEIEALKAKESRTDMEGYIIKRGEAWEHDGELADVPVHALRIGNLGLVGLPAEIFVRIGLDIKHWSPADFTMAVELANARASTYVPTAQQAERGAYGARPILSRRLCADAGRQMADTAQVLLCKLWE